MTKVSNVMRAKGVAYGVLERGKLQKYINSATGKESIKVNIDVLEKRIHNCELDLKLLPENTMIIQKIVNMKNEITQLQVKLSE